MNKTQCPHCYTIYVISDEQFRTSQGMVRCGTCRERFQAQLLTADSALKFDADSAFIEPLSKHSESSKVTADDFISPDPDIELAEPGDGFPHDETVEIAGGNLQASAFATVGFDFGDSMNSQLSIAMSDETIDPVDPQEMARIEQVIQNKLKPTKPKTTKTQGRASIEIPSTEDGEDGISEEKLIDEVDSLIDDKLLGLSNSIELETVSELSEADQDSVISEQVSVQESSVQSYIEEPSIQQVVEEPSESDDIFAPSKRKRSSIGQWLGGTLLLLVSLSLVAVLLYQMWLKQRLPLAENPQVSQALRPLQARLEDLDIKIPVRRNLSQLELLSARAEAHPSRSSTQLLRVSLINRADISQPLPWLELSLSDADGRQISRRKLAPADYIFNNRTNSQIGAKELKKITIELLAFPKQATGYELRLLNK